jgi:hypothetical protein
MTLPPGAAGAAGPGTFGCLNLTFFPLDGQAKNNVDKLQGYFEWAKADKRIAGFNPWHCPGPPRAFRILKRPSLFPSKIRVVATPHSGTAGDGADNHSVCGDSSLGRHVCARVHRVCSIVSPLSLSTAIGRNISHSDGRLQSPWPREWHAARVASDGNASSSSRRMAPAFGSNFRFRRTATEPVRKSGVTRLSCTVK